jgi:hypothetical protein
LESLCSSLYKFHDAEEGEEEEDGTDPLAKAERFGNLLLLLTPIIVRGTFFTIIYLFIISFPTGHGQHLRREPSHCAVFWPLGNGLTDATVPEEKVLLNRCYLSMRAIILI